MGQTTPSSEPRLITRTRSREVFGYEVAQHVVALAAERLSDHPHDQIEVAIPFLVREVPDLRDVDVCYEISVGGGLRAYLECDFFGVPREDAYTTPNACERLWEAFEAAADSRERMRLLLRLVVSDCIDRGTIRLKSDLGSDTSAKRS